MHSTMILEISTETKIQNAYFFRVANLRYLNVPISHWNPTVPDSRNLRLQLSNVIHSKLRFCSFRGDTGGDNNVFAHTSYSSSVSYSPVGEVGLYLTSS